MINEETFRWIKVRLRDSTEGFAYGKYVGRPTDDRLVLQKMRTGWRIIELGKS